MYKVICNNIVDVLEKGIVLASANGKLHINFDECAKNFLSEKGGVLPKCVGTRDITTLSFIFYTCPKINVIFKRCFFKDHIAGKSAVNKFLALQKAIIQAGYTSYDLS